MMNKYLTKSCLLLAVILVFSACKSGPTNPNQDDPPTNEPTNQSPVADPAADAQTVDIGEKVTLDASGSSDPDGDALSYEWELTVPDGSSTQLSDLQAEDPTFTPDISGDYRATLTVDDGNGETDQENITVTVVEPSAVELEGTIAQDSVLTNIFDDETKPDYLVVGNLDIDAKLTVKPGVIMYFKENMGMNVSGSGILIADGTSDSTVVFTGETQTTNGFWRGINVYSNSVENSISHAEISYAGSKSAGTYFEAAALTVDRAKIQLSDVTISHSGAYGIQTRRDESEFKMTNMQFNNNDADHGYVHASQMGYFDANSVFDGGYVTVYGGSSTGDMHIAALGGAKYQILSKVDFDHNIVIDAGAVFEFAADAGLDINAGSTIKAQGTANNKIVFTGTAKSAGAWRGIFVGSSSVENIFEHVEISYAGSSSIRTYFDKTNMAIDRAKVTLRNVSLTGSGGYGIQTRRDGSTFSVENSTFENNANSDMLIHPTQVGFIDSQTNFNGGDVEVYKGDTQTSGSATWSDLNNGRFYFSGNVTIENTVTIEEGARFEMGTDTKLVVTEGSSHTGILKAIGTSSESIVFTGRAKAKGAWGGILINSGSVENEMDYVTIRYGGGTDLATYMDAGNLGVYNESYLKISNSTIEHSANYGLIVRTGRNASVTKNNVTFANNDNTDEYSY